MRFFFSLNKLTADKSTVLNYLLYVLGDKELKPVSFRVREAAEGLLTVIMEHLVCYMVNFELANYLGNMKCSYDHGGWIRTKPESLTGFRPLTFDQIPFGGSNN